MTYRLAKISDVDDAHELIKASIIKMEADGIYQWDEIYPAREDLVSDVERKSLFLAMDEGSLAAIYVINNESDDEYKNGKWEYDEKYSCIVHRFCVSPAYQNKGIGREVLAHIEAQAHDMGYESIRLDVFTKNPYAQKLYRKNGYQVRGFADWRKGRFDLMEKKL